MNILLKTIAATAVVTGLAAPLAAQSSVGDPMTMSCADFTAMDNTAMMETIRTMSMITGMTEEDKADMMGMTDDQKAAKMADVKSKIDMMTEAEKAAAMESDEAVMAKIVAACAATPDATVLDTTKTDM